LSYKKYSAPFVTEKIDSIALVVAIIGWLILFIQPYVSITIGLFLVAMVLGMRPGYGRYETVIGFLVSGTVWLLTTTFL